MLFLFRYHLIVGGTENGKIKLDSFTNTNLKKEKLLDIIFDDKLKFQYHIENLRKKVSLILGALPRVAFCRSTTKEDFKQYLFSLTV